MKKKCYIYTRVSTAAQTEGYSLEAQQERLRQYAEYKNLEIAGEYCDAGKSGKSILGRPAFMEMMDDIASGKDQISYVLVFKLSRFGRNAADVLKSIQTLLDYDVDLVCVEDSIDSSTQGGRLTLAILSAVAEIERENIRVQFMAGRMQKMLEGGWAGGPAPFGYRNKNGKLTVEPGEAEIVRLIYAKYLEPDMKLATVVRWLNDHGYRRISRGSPAPITGILPPVSWTILFTAGRLYITAGRTGAWMSRIRGRRSRSGESRKLLSRKKCGTGYRRNGNRWLSIMRKTNRIGSACCPGW